jgi:hypothetical protein
MGHPSASVVVCVDGPPCLVMAAGYTGRAFGLELSWFAGGLFEFWTGGR